MNTQKLIKITVAALLVGAVLSPIAAPQAHADVNVRIGANIGMRLPNGSVSVSLGSSRYHYHGGAFYQKTNRGYVAVKAPRGAVVRRLPDRYTRVVVRGKTYYRHSDIYYRRVSSGYVVVDNPDVVVVQADTRDLSPVESDVASSYSVWLGERELILKNGQFFRNTAKGLVWVETPYGAVSKTPPPYAQTIWYEEIDYLESNGVIFRNSPDGYKVVSPPWDEEVL